MSTGATVTDALWTGMRGMSGVPGCVVTQPSTLCNLACEYCYLPDRAHHRPMSVAVARATADAVNAWAEQSPGFGVVWHGAEPLAAGRAALAELMAPFVGVEHNIQTNATLINDAWCELFVRNGVSVSISVDGPEELNTHRVTRGNTPVYRRIMKGVRVLKDHGVPFSALCVVNAPRPGLARDLYEYFLGLGCEVLGISMEEHEGVNERCTDRDTTAVREFWAELVASWRMDPKIRIREVEHSLQYTAAVLAGTADRILPRAIDPMPMVAADGRVFLFSPELAGFSDSKYGDFSSGHILSTPLPEILRSAAAELAANSDYSTGGASSGRWIRQFIAGVEKCRATCPFFGFCGGAHAANRYFEQGRFDGTETNHCRSSKIWLLQGVLDHLDSGAQRERQAEGDQSNTAAPTTPSGDELTKQIVRVSDELVRLLDGIAATRGVPAGASLPAGCAESTKNGTEGGSTSFYNWHNRPR